ncbi:hypothetical protein [Aurantiacibacter rhizosphaerae]|uniref:META domain-containing protein n=1 Tax=Aurantiacibacter rhizosphaerae TaxID=2691582 RepID=A0A844XA10_9SPHN|nr:hypothetical protein [Aurantiacibacter rhizosphaerae]MWV26582.1 hypothetical protein [Aurantiacibacter rhizosphaerae]
MRLIEIATLATAVLALAACSSESEPEEQVATLPAPGGIENPPPAPPTTPISPIETLAGEWRVAGIDGEELDEAYGLALSADDADIWWEPRCANVAFGYRIDGLNLETGTAESFATVGPDGNPPPICTVGKPARLADVTRALDLAETVGRTPSNGVLIEGGGHSVLLFSQ